jgi:hypothetical protein
MYLPQDRFVIHDPQLDEFIPALDGSNEMFAEASFEEALRVARLEAQTRGHDLMVGDQMARHGETWWWRVSPNGEFAPEGQKP